MHVVLTPPTTLAFPVSGELESFDSGTRSDEDVLRELAASIKAGHANVEKAGQAVVAIAVTVGRLLSKAKGLVGHGNWQTWVEGNCGFSGRTAQDYIRVAKAIDEGLVNPQHAADFTIRQILAQVRSHKTSRTQTREAPSLLSTWGRACNRLIEVSEQFTEAELDDLDFKTRDEVRKLARLTVSQLLLIGRKKQSDTSVEVTA
jgi:hypothetical protein